MTQPTDLINSPEPSDDDSASISSDVTVDETASEEIIWRSAHYRQKKWEGLPLRRQLLTRFLPGVLVPLGLAGLLSYNLTAQRASKNAEKRLENQALVASKAVQEILIQADNGTQLIAINPFIITAAQQGSTFAKSSGINQQPIPKLENDYKGNLVLQSNQSLNQYLSRFTNAANLRRMFFTDEHGYNLAYAGRPNDFVQRDEKWWLDTKDSLQKSLRVDFETLGVEVIHPIIEFGSRKFTGVVKAVVSSEDFNQSFSNFIGTDDSLGSEEIQVLSVDENNRVIPLTTWEMGQRDPETQTQEVLGGEEIEKEVLRLIQEQTSDSESFINNPGQNETPVTLLLEQGRQYALAKLGNATNSFNSAQLVVAVSVPQREINAAGGQIATLFGFLFLAVGAVSTVIIYRFTRYLSQPMDALVKATDEAAAGNLDVQAQAKGVEETQRLATSFNNLVNQLKGQLTETEQARLQAESLSQEQQTQNQALQMQLVELLSDVEGASRGDLTVRADVTEGAIGTVGDFFNSIIESLRMIVTQVKQSATQVNSSLEANEGEIQQLADEALKQAAETTRTLNSVEQMTDSIQAVAKSAQKAAEVARNASETAQSGEKSMDRTVENILSLRETVAETAKKVKRLGESSQQISKVVSLINQIALQTNLLAINAGIEAARAGEQGQGFAVVAEEVGELAARSAKATQDIERIVETIQRETAQVVEAMEDSTTQVVEGTNLVEEAKQSLGEILKESQRIDQLVNFISEAAVSQVETSESVSTLMKEIAQVSERTSDSSRAMSQSLQQTLDVAQKLQTSVETFKVSAE